MTSLFWLAMTLAAREPNAASVVAPRGIATVHILLDLDASREEREILLSIGHHESRWNHRALNPAGDCGPTQVRLPVMWGSTCAAIQADPVEGYRVSLRILRHAQVRCSGTWQRVLTLYVSGKCGVAPLKAREICDPVGLCEVKP